MTDDQIINSLVKFALKVHHPAPIPVGDILLRKYDCDHRQKDIILIQIEHYNLMELIDNDSGSLMRFTRDGLTVATSDNPIEAINKLVEDRKPKHSTQILNITGDVVNSPVTQVGKNQFLDRLPVKTPNLKDEYIHITKSNKVVNSFKSIFKEYFQYIAWGASISTAVLAWYKFVYLKQ